LVAFLGYKRMREYENGRIGKRDWSIESRRLGINRFELIFYYYFIKKRSVFSSCEESVQLSASANFTNR
jgi:hypothetical protein